ncbi:hypothetical protein Q8A67_021519 [Cirrhinus molitorella]|uniref:Uncharacterized protein n=1 Tax=Cirrhinus molitorella TaxID=172907 RepID=A0AA88PHQ1_9TELE|nr:hypothetical protein Q8A67_021519 [Cirrhinus molitorella]
MSIALIFTYGDRLRWALRRYQGSLFHYTSNSPTAKVKAAQGDIGESEAKGSMMKPSAFAITHGTAGSRTRFLPSLALCLFYICSSCVLLPY